MTGIARCPRAAAATKHAVAALLTAAGLASGGTAQLSLADGYTHQLRFRENAAPQTFAAFAIGPGDRLFAAVGSDLVEVDALGNRQVLHAFSSGRPAGLVAHPRNAAELFFTESGTSTMWRRDLASGAQRQGNAPAQAFDLAIAPSGEILVSANPSWPAPGAGNGIWSVDFTGGNHRRIALLSGPSGPLVFDATGNLYYAVQSPTYPTPAGSVTVLRFDAARVQQVLQGGAALTAADASARLSGLDGAYDLAFDDRGRLYISDPQHGDVRRTLPGALRLDPMPLLARPVAPSTAVVLQLAFTDAGAETFDPYQPDRGAALYAHRADWLQLAEVQRIATARPFAVSSPTAVAGPGPITFRISGLPPGGIGWLCITALPAAPERAALWLGGTPLWTGLDWRIRPICIGLTALADGTASAPMHHAGGFGGTIYTEAVGVDALPSPGAFGSSAVYALTLLP